MSVRVLKSGAECWITEYETREIDANGDALNVNHHETAEEAIESAPALITGEVVAVTVEKHRSRHPSRGHRDQFTLLATFGDPAALAAHAG